MGQPESEAAHWLPLCARHHLFGGGDNDAPALACLLALRTRDRARVSVAGLQGGARAGGAHRLRGAVCVFDPSTGRELELALLCFVAYLVAYSSAEKWSMSGLKSTLARCESCTHLLRNDTHSYPHQCATQPKLWSVSSLASSAIGASSPPSDGLSQRGILLVHGVRARRGGVAREGEGAQFDSDPQERGSDCKFGCRAIALHSSKKGFGLLRVF